MIGLDGSADRSASSSASFSAFLAARAFFLASSASTFEFDLAPLDHSACSLAASCSCAFAAFASLAAAF